ESCGCENSGGEIIEPIYILLTGRATKKHNGIEVPVDRIAVEAARNYIDQNFKVLSSDHIEFDARIGETSTDLKSIYDKEGAPKSNDTSFGVGHAPLSPVEKTVRTLEKVLHEKIEAAGEDIKVMGLRTEDKLKLTVATAVIDSRVTEMEEYQETVSKIKELSREHAEKHTDLETEVNVNTADIIEDESVYLTVTGTSAEMGDDGSVGRGNRSNGLITPHRAMSLEASSGKNPVSHVGKIYNLLAQQIAQDIHEKSGEYAEVKILSQIGKPIDKPEAVDVETSADRELVEKTVEKKLENIQDITDKIVYGELKTY
ncbi:MAG: S-adenosylmethionine synthetase, partial [Nanohaloarchaea archaeon QH_8_44_6]